MINKISKLRIPGWLKSIAKNPETASFPLKSILKDSLYYSVSKSKGDPVKLLAGNVFSFIYIDEINTRQDFLSELNTKNVSCEFENYSPVLIKEISRDEILPDEWKSTIKPWGNENQWKWYVWERRRDFFGYWSVWKRNPSAKSNVGPELFSFLYLGGDISLLYEALYIRNNTKPKFLVGDSDNTFRRVVKSNSAGTSEYLLCDECDYESLGWDEYDTKNDLCFPVPIQTKLINFVKSLEKPFVDFICGIGTIIAIAVAAGVIDDFFHKNDEKIYDKLKEINNKLL